MKALVYTGVETLDVSATWKNPPQGQGETLVRIDGGRGSAARTCMPISGTMTPTPRAADPGARGRGRITGGPGRPRDDQPAGHLRNMRCVQTGAEPTSAARGRSSRCRRAKGRSPNTWRCLMRTLWRCPMTRRWQHAALAEPLAGGLACGPAGYGGRRHHRRERRGDRVADAIGRAALAGFRACGRVTISEPNRRRRAFWRSLRASRAVQRRQGANSRWSSMRWGMPPRALRPRPCAPGGVHRAYRLGEDTGGLDIRRMTLQEITFIGTYTYTAQDFRDTARPYLTARLGAGLDRKPRFRWAGAFADIRAGRTAAKIMLTHN